MPITPTNSFKWRHFQGEVILLCVRWYPRYPLVCMAAHTGARRSELARMLVTDVDFQEGTVTVREKKRVKAERSTRRAPLTPLLRRTLEEWLATHPGGPSLFCHGGEVRHSKKRSRSTRACSATLACVLRTDHC